MDSLGLAKLLFRSAELFAALMALWWLHSHIPLAGDYLRRLSTFIASPLFVFLLCHVIVVSLMADSGKFSLRTSDAVQSSDLLSDRQSDAVSDPDGEIVFEDKQVISESAAIKSDDDFGEEEEDEIGDGDFECSVQIRRLISEINSENLPFSHDKLSDDDFHRIVEAFIAKQLKFRQQEHSPDFTRRLCASIVTTIAT